MRTLLFHGNFQSAEDFSKHTSDEIKVFPLWEFLRTHQVKSWEEFADSLAAEIDFEKYSRFIGYSLGGRILQNLLVGGGRAKRSRGPYQGSSPPREFIFLSTHPGLQNKDERAARAQTDKSWRDAVLTSDWQELCARWNAQDLFAGDAVDPKYFAAIEKHRNQIATAFDVLSLATMPAFCAADLAAATEARSSTWHWVVGEFDHKFVKLGQDFCHDYPENLRIIKGAGHRLYKHFGSLNFT